MVEILFYDVRQSLAPLNEEEMIQREKRTQGGIDIPYWKSSYERHYLQYRGRISLFAE